jgi:rod shape-determining protein MreC
LINRQSVIAVSRRTGQVLATGADARRMLDRRPAEIVLMPTLRARRRTRSTPLFVGLCAFTAALTVVSQQPWAAGARGAAKSALAPALGAVDAVVAPIDRMTATLGNNAALRSENDRLRLADQQLRAQLLQLDTVEKDNAQLRQALNFAQSSGYHMVAATVVGRGADGLSLTMEVDRGTDDGVRAGMVVVTGAGLLGRVSEAGPRFAIVQTLADTQAAVDVELVNSNVQGTVIGGASPFRLKLDQPPGVVVAAGDWALTSGTGGAYPRGLVVGEVSEPGRLAWVNDPREVDFVLVITDFEPS